MAIPISRRRPASTATTTKSLSAIRTLSNLPTARACRRWSAVARTATTRSLKERRAKVTNYQCKSNICRVCSSILANLRARRSTRQAVAISIITPSKSTTLKLRPKSSKYRSTWSLWVMVEAMSAERWQRNKITPTFLMLTCNPIQPRQVSISLIVWPKRMGPLVARMEYCIYLKAVKLMRMQRRLKRRRREVSPWVNIMCVERSTMAIESTNQLRLTHLISLATGGRL